MKFLIITGDNCPYCDKAKATLATKGFEYQELNLMENPELYTVMLAAQQKTVPLIFQIVGGSDDLDDMLKTP